VFNVKFRCREVECRLKARFNQDRRVRIQGPSPSRLSGRWSPVGRLRRFLRDRHGATALEFGLVALPFLVVILQVLELSLVFLVYAQLDTALANASRSIRTGALQKGGAPTA